MIAKENIKRPQSLGEEIANAITHGVGTLLSIAGTVVAIVYSAKFGDALSVVSASLYGAGLIILYLFSTLYHSLTNKTAKKVFQIFDHCSIFLLILCSYIPVCLAFLRGALGWTLFGINAFCAVLGIVLNSVNLQKFKKISMIIYIVMGWSGVFVFATMFQKLSNPISALGLLLGGGILYTVGIVFYKLPKYKYMHSIWHVFVLMGSILQYFFMLFYTLKV